MPKIAKRNVKSGEKVFDIGDDRLSKGAWWWWFWLFFFDNPKDPEKPRQLMILWSTKNCKKISCNDLLMKINEARDGNKLQGAVAAWYFDGERMHHDYLLEKCNIMVSEDKLSTDSKEPTDFSIRGETNMVRIGDKMTFIAEPGSGHDFLKPSYHGNNFVGGKGYEITKVNRLELKGEVEGEKIKGSAYFQRVFVNAPAIPWYWGVFHFENGAVLTYTNQLLMGKSIKKNISFFDGEKMHDLSDIKVKRIGGELPKFEVRAEDGKKKMRFTVEPYSHSSWTFKKSSLGFIPNKFVYNEYPAKVSRLEFMDEESGKKLTLKNLGKNVGNAEHSRGYLT